MPGQSQPRRAWPVPRKRRKRKLLRRGKRSRRLSKPRKRNRPLEKEREARDQQSRTNIRTRRFYGGPSQKQSKASRMMSSKNTEKKTPTAEDMDEMGTKQELVSPKQRRRERNSPHHQNSRLVRHRQSEPSEQPKGNQNRKRR